MAKKKKGTGYVAQDGSRAYFDRLAQQGVQQNNPAGTAYLMGSNNLGYGVVGAYDANNNFLGFVRGNLGDGVRVNYNAGGAATGITMPGQAASGGGDSGGGGGGGDKKPPPFTTGYDPDSIYVQAMQSLAAKRNQYFDPQTGRYATGERELANEYGLGINQDGSGASFTGQWAASDPNQLGIDPSNPFSRASLLNKSYFVSGKVGEGSYANRGLLSSGAYQRSMDRDNFRFLGGKSDLLRSFGKQLMDYRQQRQDTAASLAAEEAAQRDALFSRRRDEYDRMYPS